MIPLWLRLGTVFFASFFYVSHAIASDVYLYMVAKGAYYQQVSSSIVMLSPEEPYSFFSAAFAPGPGTVTSVTGRHPNGETQIFEWDSEANSYAMGRDFSTKQDLDRSFPSGAYGLIMNTAHDGNRSANLSLSGDRYPAAPQITNFEDTRLWIAENEFTLRWNSWTNPTENTLVLITIDDQFGNQIFTTPMYSQPGALTVHDTSFVIPANTFSPYSSYQITLGFVNIVNANTTAYPGASGISGYYSRTRFGVYAVEGTANAVTVYRNGFENGLIPEVILAKQVPNGTAKPSTAPRRAVASFLGSLAVNKSR